MGSLPLAVVADEPKSAIEDVRRLQDIANQKLEMDVRQAFQEADRLAKTDPAKASATLKSALTLVEEEGTVDAQRRESLTRLLRVRMRILEASAKKGSDSAEVDAKAIMKRAEEERRQSEQETIARALQNLRALRLEGRLDEARRLADELAKRYPNQPAVVAASHAATATERAVGHRMQQLNRDRGLAAARRDTDLSATPAVGDVDFPSDWTARTKGRIQASPLTDKEKSILKALDAPVAVAFRGESFENAIKELSARMNQPILLDRIALEEAQVKYDSAITFETPSTGLAARTVLRRMLGDFGLNYVIKNQAIEVTSALRAKNLMVVRSYFIGDLLNNPSLATILGPGNIPYPTTWWTPAAVTQALTNQQAEQVVEMIKQSVEPASWGSGGGSILYSAATMSLVVRQSAEVHGMIANGLLR
jgi:hypothetical protein